jgi:RNA-directed DNA polymerase
LLCSKDVAALLGRLMTVDGHLPSGSQASLLLSYLINRRTYDEIALFAEAKGLEMTLHVDDARLSVQVSSPRRRST